MDQDFLSRKVELAYLTAFYGGLLTDRQKEILSMYCEDDMSLGEIASVTGISRQGVFNTLRRGAEHLFHLETSLGMAERFRVMYDGLEDARNLLAQGHDTQAREKLDELIRFYSEEDANGL